MNHVMISGGYVRFDPSTIRCKVHKCQQLHPAHEYMGRTIMTCTICNARIVDEIVVRNDYITITVRGVE